MFDDLLDDADSLEDELVCRDSYGLPMSLNEFKKTNAHKNGCASCSDVLNPDDEFIWYGNNEGDAMCGSCAAGV